MGGREGRRSEGKFSLVALARSVQAHGRRFKRGWIGSKLGELVLLIEHFIVISRVFLIGKKNLSGGPIQPIATKIGKFRLKFSIFF